MGVVDIDAELLRESAKAATHVAKQAGQHIIPEYAGDTPAIMETLVASEPYAFAIYPQFLADGVIKLPIQTTRDEVRRNYERNWAELTMLDFRLTTEVRGTWYVLKESLNTTQVNSTGKVSDSGQTVTLITASNSTVAGITGEMCWARVPRAMLGAGERSGEAQPSEGLLRHQMFLLHDRYLDALRAEDVEAMLATMNEGVQSPVRNYVEDTGALVLLESLDAHRSHLVSFFGKYEVLSAEPLTRIAQDWYLFAELRLAVRDRVSGANCAFHTAEIFAPAHDGRFIARIGHGTDPK